jgi:predicted transposase YbfD/YdcC
VLAIDGKTLRRSFDRAAGRSALHVVTAFGAEARLSVGQRAVAPGENEITAARALLATLTLDGALVTGDAVHAQAETAQLVLDRGGDYLLALKANRPAMLEAVAAFFADPPEALAAVETTDADHGRVETRRHRVTHCTGWIFGDRAEPGAPIMPGRWPASRPPATTAPVHPLPPLLRPPHPGTLRPRGPRPLGHREQPPLGPRCDLRRGRRAQPQRLRPREPRHPATPDPQPAAKVPPKAPHQPEAKALRLVRRLRKNHHRPNAIALWFSTWPLAIVLEPCMDGSRVTRGLVSVGNWSGAAMYSASRLR